MTFVKKMNPDWMPQEHPGILVGDVVDFPGNVQKLLEEGNVILCDSEGNEISTYEALGIVTDRELEEFKQWKHMQAQQKLLASLESQREELLAEATQFKQPIEEESMGTVEDARNELEEKKKAWAAKMAEARAKKKAEQEAQSA